MKLAKQVAKNTFYRTMAKIVGNVSGVFIAAILARILGPRGFGVYSLALSISLLCMSLADQGIIATSIKYISYYHGRQDLVNLRSYFRYFVKLELLISLFTSLAIIVFSGSLSSIFKDSLLKMPLIFAGLTVLFGATLNVVTSLFAGLQRFEYTFIKQVLYEAFRWLLVIPLSMLFFASGAVAGTCLAYAFTFIFLVSIILKKFKPFVFGNVKNISKRKIGAFIGFMSLTNVSSIVLSYTDIIMIGYLLSTTDVGYYRAAVTVIIAVIGLLTVFDVLLSAFSRFDDAELKNAVEKISKYSVALSFPLAIIIFYLSNNIIYIIYGCKYKYSVGVLSVLSLMLFPNAFNFIGPVFISKDMPEYPAMLTIIAMVSNIILNYIFILKFGIVGAAVATVASRCLMTVLGIYLLIRYFNVAICDLMVKSIFSVLVVVAILKVLPSMCSIFCKIVFSIILLLVYFVIMFIIRGLTVEDLIYIKELI